MTRLDQSMTEIGAWQNFPPHSGLCRALIALAARADAYASRSRHRRALAELDARLLDDIGVTAHDAAREAAKPFWR